MNTLEKLDRLKQPFCCSCVLVPHWWFVRCLARPSALSKIGTIFPSYTSCVVLKAGGFFSILTPFHCSPGAAKECSSSCALIHSFLSFLACFLTCLVVSHSCWKSSLSLCVCSWFMRSIVFLLCLFLPKSVKQHQDLVILNHNIQYKTDAKARE